MIVGGLKFRGSSNSDRRRKSRSSSRSKTYLPPPPASPPSTPPRSSKSVPKRIDVSTNSNNNSGSGSGSGSNNIKYVNGNKGIGAPSPTRRHDKKKHNEFDTPDTACSTPPLPQSRSFTNSVTSQNSQFSRTGMADVSIMDRSMGSYSKGDDHGSVDRYTLSGRNKQEQEQEHSSNKYDFEEVTTISVNFEAADDDLGGVELYTDDFTHATESSEKMAIQATENERNEYKKHWGKSPKRSSNNSGEDPMLGIVFHASTSGEQSGDDNYHSQHNFKGKNGADIIDDGISDASLPSYFHGESVSKAAVRAVSRLLDRQQMALHLPSDVQLSSRGGGGGGGVLTPKHDNHKQFPNASSNDQQSQTQQQVMPSTPTPSFTPNDSTEIDHFKDKLTQPSKQLAELIEAIRQGDDYTRRKNACGALKVLTTNGSNRKRIAWTMGVLPAIGDVLRDDFAAIDPQKKHSQQQQQQQLHPSPSSARIMAYLDASIRSVGALLNLCQVSQNRVLIFHCPGLIEGMIHTIYNDRAESRQGLCACLALLAKTPDNRVPIVKKNGLMEALMLTISTEADKNKPSLGKVDPSMSPASTAKTNNKMKKKQFYGNDNDADSFTSFDSSRLRSKYDIEKKEMSTVSMDSRITQGATNNDRYDKTNLPFLNGARVHIFACCLHLVKDKEAVYHLVRNVNFMSTIIEVANRFDSPAHTRCIAMIAHLSRLNANVHRMVFHVKFLLRTLVRASNSHDSECRKYACLALENLSCERACRQEIANVPGLIHALCSCCTNMGYEDQQLAAVSALRNLADEPANLIPLSNSKDCLASLIRLARMNYEEEYMHHRHSGADGDGDGDEPNEEDSKSCANKKMELMQFYACDAIATISFWMTTVANTNGKTLVEKKDNFSTLQVSGWEQWL